MIPEARPSVKSKIAGQLLRWFARHKRDLPWRRGTPRDAYRVWLAEVMLQQTQVATVIPYYQRWLERFPTLKDLADAPIGDVLKHWEGLGYYSRARNFHRAAQIVARDHAGRVPDTLAGLAELPGIGRYTAGAIASLAFGRDAPVLDGNMKRVLCRLFAIGDPPATVNHQLWQLSASLLPHGRAGEFNEAMMDLGATVCAPRQPACDACPLRRECVAHQHGHPEDYPARQPRAVLPHRIILTAVIRDAHGRLLLAQRPMRGLLGGLWEFPGGELLPSGDRDPSPAAGETIASRLSDIILARTGLRVAIEARDFAGQVKHAFTHFRMTRHIAIVELRASRPKLRPSHDYLAMRWLAPDELARLALARSDQKILLQCAPQAATGHQP